MRIPLRCPAPALVVAAGFGGNSPGAWQFGAIRGSIVPGSDRERSLIVRRIVNAILLVVGWPGAGLLGAAPTAAQTYDPRHPVCIEIYTIDGCSIDCSFATIAQCAATASGQSAQCYANPYATQSRQPSPVPSPPRRSR